MHRTGRFFIAVSAVLALSFAAWPADAGKLAISTDPPEAMIFVDGEYRGLSPVTIDAGREPLAIRATKKGRHDCSKVFQPDGTDQELRLSLAQDAGCSLSISSRPSGASVFIDGRHSGQTPLTLENLQADEHDVRLELRDYLPSSQTVRLAAGKPEQLDVQLVPAAEEMLRGKIARDPANLALHCALAQAFLARNAVNEGVDALLDGLAAWDGIEPLDPRSYALPETLRKVTAMLNGRNTLYEKCTLRIARDADKLCLYVPLRDFYRDPHYRETLGAWFAGLLEKPHSRLAADALDCAFREFIGQMRAKNSDEKLVVLESLAARYPQAGISLRHRLEAFVQPGSEGRVPLQRFLAGLNENERMDARLAILKRARYTGMLDQVARDLLKDEPAAPGVIECLLPRYAHAIGITELERLSAEHPGLQKQYAARFARAYSILRKPDKARELSPLIYGLPEETFHPSITQNEEAEKLYRENSNKRDKLLELMEKYPRTGAACRAYYSIWPLLDPTEAPALILAHVGEYRQRTQDLLHLASVYRYNLLDAENALKTYREYVDARQGFRYTPDDAMALFQIATLFLKGMDDPENAADYFGRYFDLVEAAGDERLAEAYVLAGESWRKLGQIDKAVEWWKGLCERAPGLREAIHVRTLAVRYFGKDLVDDK